MHLYKLLPQNHIHPFHSGRMRPVRIMYSREGNPLIVALLGGVHHVGGVEGVDEVWGKC